MAMVTHRIHDRQPDDAGQIANKPKSPLENPAFYRAVKYGAVALGIIAAISALCLMIVVIGGNPNAPFSILRWHRVHRNFVLINCSIALASFGLSWVAESFQNKFTKDPPKVVTTRDWGKGHQLNESE